MSESSACFCIGPQPGQTLCPCQLRATATQRPFYQPTWKVPMNYETDVLKARIAELEALVETFRFDNLMLLENNQSIAAERDALKARIAGGVSVEVELDNMSARDSYGWWTLSQEEHAALLPLDGQTVTVIAGEAKP